MGDGVIGRLEIIMIIQSTFIRWRLACEIIINEIEEVLSECEGIIFHDWMFSFESHASLYGICITRQLCS